MLRMYQTLLNAAIPDAERQHPLIEQSPQPEYLWRGRDALLGSQCLGRRDVVTRVQSPRSAARASCRNASSPPDRNSASSGLKYAESRWCLLDTLYTA